LSEDGRFQGTAFLGEIEARFEVDVDDIRCVADCNGDGNVDILDFVCQQNLFGEGHPAADCDCDGMFTVLDFVCFQNRASAGCE
jgi:hypothetical protein